MSIKVLKFGGSVLKNSDDVKNIKNIILLNKNCKMIVLVVSAFYGITNKLLEIGEKALKQIDYRKSFEELKAYHINIAKQLEIQDKNIYDIESLFKKIQNCLLSIGDKKNLNNEAKDYLMSFGERLSAWIIYSFLLNSLDIDIVSSCEIIKTDDNFGNANVDFDKTDKLIIKKFSAIKKKIIVCGGFFASNDENTITTLGRNGSDYSASIIASALKAEILEIWKDIDGLYTSDPKIVKNVQFINKITYQEMEELSSLGNKVVCMKAILPCIKNNIPIVLKNCYNINNEGTLISNEENDKLNINGITKLDNVCVITILTGEHINNEKLLSKLYKIIKIYKNDIITISINVIQQIVTIISKSDVELYDILKEKIIGEKYNNFIKINMKNKISMITIVGSKLYNLIGVSGTIFGSLQENNINVYAINDDFSPTRISFLCKDNDANNVIKILHKKLVEEKVMYKK